MMDEFIDLLVKGMGIWGGILSTLIYISSRPILFLEPKRKTKTESLRSNDRMRLFLKIENPSNRSAFLVEKYWKYGRGWEALQFSRFNQSDLSEVIEDVIDQVSVGRKHDFSIYVGPQSEVRLVIHGIQKDTNCWVIFGVRRLGILPCFPSWFIKINGERALRINKGGKGINNQPTSQD
jgi:hypothetical protein